MALKKVAIGLGQSNEEGAIFAVDLPAALRGPQANRFIFNFENSAVETMNVDGVGPNLPNTNTGHIAGAAGPNLRTAEQLLTVAGWGEVFYFHFGLGGTPMGPSTAFRTWNTFDEDLYTEFKTRWNAFITVMTGLGHTVSVEVIFWTQGEGDAAGPDGRDRAYYGLFRNFISSVREFLKPWTTVPRIKWTTGVITSQLHTSYTYERIHNVRAALMRAGWDDQYYRMVDLDKYTHQADHIHLDPNGVNAYAIARVAAYLQTTSNVMVLDEYTLGAIRSQLRNEFGIDNTPNNNSIIDDRINKAVLWVCNRRKNWPFMERQHSILIGENAFSIVTPFSANRFGSALFTHGSYIATDLASTGTPVVPREFISFETAGNTKGILVKSTNGGGMELFTPYMGDSQVSPTLAIITGNPTTINISPTSLQGGAVTLPTLTSTFVVRIAGTTETVPGAGPPTLDGAYQATRIDNDTFTIPVDTTGSTYSLGFAQIGIAFRVIQGIFELPEDYIRNTTLHLEDNEFENTLYMRSPALFEREVRAARISTEQRRLYTVVPDPIHLNDRSYLMVFPYFTGNDDIVVKYYGMPRRLIADDDVPEIPRADSFVLWYASAWFVAQWQKDTDLIGYFRDGALNELERMAKEYQLSDDITETLPGHESDIPGPIKGPEGFPEFDEP